MCWLARGRIHPDLGNTGGIIRVQVSRYVHETVDMAKEKRGAASLQGFRMRNRGALHQQAAGAVQVDRLLTPTIGIELDIADVSRADDEAIRVIRRHLVRHKVVSIRASSCPRNSSWHSAAGSGRSCGYRISGPCRISPKSSPCARRPVKSIWGCSAGTGIRISVFSSAPLKSPYCIQGRFRRAAGTRYGRT